MIATLFDFILHADVYLVAWAGQNAWWVFAALFAVIFIETGFVLWPFLPGDSILFVGGAVCAASGLDVHLLVALLIFAAVAGDNVNYAVGRFVGPKIVARAGTGVFRFIKPAYLEHTQTFFVRYGVATIIIGRFLPFVRTFAPFLAGVGKMPYRRYLSFDILGGVLWITLFVYLGYIFGNIPWVKSNLKLLALGIVVVSVAPVALKVFLEWRKTKVARA